MTEFYEDTEQIDTSLFQEGIVLENYFAGGGHGEVLSQVHGALQDGVALIVLTGDEGSGKTMLCHMFEHKSPPDCVTVFFPRTVDSFDDVVRVIAERLDLNGEDSGDGKHREGTLIEITAFLQNNSKTLVVIFDEAENIYLATLERIRKMLDRVSLLGGRMHILFSGQNTFIENYDQLSICEFERNDELHFSLRPLTRTAMAEYLRACEKHSAEFDGDTIFTDEVVADIFQFAGGNFRATKTLAQKVVAGRGDDLSYVVLEGAKEEVQAEERRSTKQAILQMFERSKEIFSELLEHGREAIPGLLSRGKGLIESTDKYRRYLPWAVAVCLLLLFMFSLFSGNDQEYVERIAHEQEETGAQVVVEDKKTEQSDQEEKVVAEERLPAEEIQTLPDDEEEQSNIENPNFVGGQETVTAEEAAGAGGSETLDTREKTEDSKEKIIAEEEVKEKPQPSIDKKIVDLQPPSSLKRKPEGSSVANQPIIKVQPRKEVTKVTPITTHYGAQQLLRKRMDAGSRWYRGGKDSLYTVQLMVLASKSAEENLVKMLSQDKYRQEAGNFFILKQKKGPGNIFVFYGEYPSIARARLAQNSLPQFLRIHKPYAISIKGAVNKIR